MATIPLTARPGAAWQYANHNFVLAGSLLETITGLTWEEYTKRNVFAPLGMTGTSFSVQDMQKAPDFSQAFSLDVRAGTNDLAASVTAELKQIDPSFAAGPDPS